MFKLAVPKNPIFNFFYGNFEKYSNLVEISRFDEKDTAEILLAHQVDAAIVSPAGYSRGVKKHDLRIIPATTLTAIDFTGLGSIYFKSGIDNISMTASESPEDFLMIIARILMSEKYGIEAHPQIKQKSIDNSFGNYDMIFEWGRSKLSDLAFDITEEWYDSYEMPLPMAFWVCRNEDNSEELQEIIRLIGDVSTESDNIIDLDESYKYGNREGKLVYYWNDEVEAALEQVLQLLYFHQLADEIAAVKLLGRD
jgi:hypothetical protein